MEATVREYGGTDGRELAGLFNRFQDYLVALDRMGMLGKRLGTFGDKYLELTLKSISRGRGKMYVAVSGGKIIGLACAVVLRLSREPGTKPGRRGRITELYVERRHRGKGIGLALIRRAEKYLKARGCKRIYIEVFAPNASARGFYRKLGYNDLVVDMIREL